MPGTSPVPSRAFPPRYGPAMADLHVVAFLPAKPGSESVVKEALTALAAATRDNEEGCLSYDLYESAAAPGTFITVELWRSQADLDAHVQTAHVAQAMTLAGEHLAGAPQIHPLVPTGA
jgi:quinol monooxygenase YgiN